MSRQAVLDTPTGKQRPEEFYRVNSGHLLVAWQADRLLWIVINDHQAIAANSPANLMLLLIIKL